VSIVSTSAVIPDADMVPAISRGILIVGNFLSGAGGTRSVAEELALRLDQRGWRVLAVSRKRNRLARLVDMTFSAWLWRKRFSVAQVDVFSGAAFLWAEAVCWTLQRARRPYVLTLHGGRLPEFALLHSRRVGRLLAAAAAVTAPSPYLLQQMAAYRPDIVLLPNALDLRLYTFRERRPPRPRLIWLRAFHRIYNPEMAVRVLAGVRARAPEATLTMIGPDKGDGSVARVRQLADELCLSHCVHIVTGVPKSEVPRWLDENDIFLNTPDIDNTPVSVLEAMACGLCIVSTNAGGLPYLLTDGQDALLTPCGDVKAMSAAVRRLLDNEDLAASLSANAARTAAPCDWPLVLRQWESLLERVAGQEAP